MNAYRVLVEIKVMSEVNYKLSENSMTRIPSFFLLINDDDL